MVSHDVSIERAHDSDIVYGVSDGGSFVGFHMEDKNGLRGAAPRFGYEGTSGTTLTRPRLINYSSPRPSDSFYPGQFVITIKLDEHWGSCYTAHDGGFVKTAVYSKRLMLNKGLTLDVYKHTSREKVTLKSLSYKMLKKELQF